MFFFRTRRRPDMLSRHLVALVALITFALLTTAQTAVAFNPDVNDTVYSIAQQTDHKLLIGGLFTSVHGVTLNGIARLHSDGRIDSTFDTGTGANGIVYAIAIQDDGKILIGGNFSSVNGFTRNNIARLHADGSVDQTFDTGTGANDIVLALALQADGKVLIGGFFTEVRGNTRNRIARLNADSSVDQTFTTGSGANDSVYALAIQDDGKVLIGGFFTVVRGNTRNRIARLNADSSVDQTFDTGSGANGSVRALALQADGKVLIGGTFTEVRGTTRNYIARLNADSTVDPIFDPGAGANSWVRALALQADGKVLIGGDFSVVRGYSLNRIARLNTDSSVDQTFDIGSGANNLTVEVLAIQNDNKVLLGGHFSVVNDIPRNRIARLNTNGSVDRGNGLCFPIKAVNGNVVVICL